MPTSCAASGRFTGRCTHHPETLVFASRQAFERHLRDQHPERVRRATRRRTQFMNSHRYRPPSRRRPRRTPVRPYVPKPFDAGQTITYTDTTDLPYTAERTGVIWSPGPEHATVWVLPDHDPTNPVAVSTRTTRTLPILPETVG